MAEAHGDRELEFQKLGRRTFLLLGVQGAGLALLGGWYYNLQVVNGQRHRLKADDNRVAVRLTEPMRGRILDRDGQILATNKKSFEVFLDPSLIQNGSETIAKLTDILNLSGEEQIRLRSALALAESGARPIMVRADVIWGQFARLEYLRNQIDGLVTSVGHYRSYPQGPQTAHLVGYVGRVSKRELEREDDETLQIPTAKIGKTGVERGFDKLMRGRHGLREIEVNAKGVELRELSVRPNIPGKDINLTLDVKLQTMAMELLGAEAGAICLMDAHQGDLLALASSPTFDPNAFVGGISQENWDALRENQQTPLVNKAVQGVYPPGSTFKTVVLAAALAEKLVRPDEEIFCPGHYDFAGNRFHCWARGGHGRVDGVTAMAQSCDVYFYHLGELLGIDRLARFAKQYGLGQRFDINLVETNGALLPTPQWKKRVLDKPWYPGETINMSIGQGRLLMTPLQMAVMTARIATGKPTLPRLTKSQPSMQNNLFIDDSGLQLVRQGMDMVVNNATGTAHASQLAPSFGKMLGKTGTVQVRRITAAERRQGIRKNDELPWKLRDHAMFVAIAGPAGKELAMSVVIEHGGSGSNDAAPKAKSMMEFALVHLGLQA